MVWSALVVGACLELPSYAWMVDIVRSLGASGGGAACVGGPGGSGSSGSGGGGGGDGSSSMFWAFQGMLALQGTGMGIAYNSISLFVANEASEGRLGNAIGLVRMGMQVAAMLGQTLVAALVGSSDDVDASGGDAMDDDEAAAVGEGGVVSIGPYRTAAAVSLWLGVLFLFFPVWLSGYHQGIWTQQRRGRDRHHHAEGEVRRRRKQKGREVDDEEEQQTTSVLHRPSPPPAAAD